MLAVGCGGDSSQKPVLPVTGSVTHEGKPVAEVIVQFTPAAAGEQAPGKGAIGTTDAEGKFTLSTYDPGDGAVIGKHTVTIGAENPANPLPVPFEPREVEVTTDTTTFDFKLGE